MSVNVFQHAGNRRELVLRAADLDLRDCAAFEAGKQHATQAVADRRAEAALERLRDELAVGASERRRIDIDDAGKLEAAPTNMHIEFSGIVVDLFGRVRLAARAIWSGDGSARASPYRLMSFTRGASWAGGSRCAAAA